MCIRDSIKWFPDRRGMATGMAIMGFGGGAMIGAPLANILINYFKTPTSVGRAVQRSLLNLMEKMDLRPPSAAA